MLIRAGFVAAFLFTSLTFAGSPTKLVSIDRDKKSGWFTVVLTRPRTNRSSGETEEEVITLSDTDGAATLGLTQMVLVDRLRQLREGNDHTIYSLKTPLLEAFPGGMGQVLTIQREALERILNRLQRKVVAGFEKERIPGSMDVALARAVLGRPGEGDLTVGDGMAIVLDLLARFENTKKPWTLEDVERMGIAIRELVGIGGKYHGTYKSPSEEMNYDDILLRNPNEWSDALLSGAVDRGRMVPTLYMQKNEPAYARGETRVSADLWVLAQRYPAKGSAHAFGTYNGH